MSVWHQYAALAHYFSLKYACEFESVIDTTTSLIDEEIETQHLFNRRKRRFSKRHKELNKFGGEILDITKTLRKAPGQTTYDESARSLRLGPEDFETATKRHFSPPLRSKQSRQSVLSQRARLHRWEPKVLHYDLSKPDLVSSVIWEATHGLLSTRELVDDVQ